MSHDDEGLPFAEAIQAYSDPDLWAAYEEAKRAAAGKWRAGYFVVAGVPTVGRDSAARIDKNNALVAARERAWGAILQAFLARLLSGEVLASGLVAPVTVDAGRVFIPPDRWRQLRLKSHGRRAEGEGLLVVDLLFHRRDENREGALAREAHAAAVPPAGDDEIPRRGRPSPMQLIGNEMQRRAERGELCGWLAAECRALRRWAETNMQGKRIPQADSIRKSLGLLYRRLKAEINADKMADKR